MVKGYVGVVFACVLQSVEALELTKDWSPGERWGGEAEEPV